MIEKLVLYIEDHLLDDLTLDDLASFSGYSKSHLHVLFRRITGDSLKQYIRLRRLSLACKDLVESDDSMIDIALKYGFESREGFLRSFEYFYGKSASEVRKSAYYYTLREPFKDHLTHVYDFNLVTMGLDLDKEEQFLIRDDESLQAKIASSITDYVIKHPLKDFVGCLEEERGDFIYSIYKPKSSLNLSLYACFEVKEALTQTIQKLWRYVYSDQFKIEGYKINDDEHLEYYYYQDDELHCKIYIKLIKDQN